MVLALLATAIPLASHDSAASAPRTILAPEEQPSLVLVCSGPVTVGHNGAIAALFCKNGDLNVRAWNYFAETHSALMRLGRSATWSQIVRASCVAERGTSYPAVRSIYLLASAYNGWHFGTSINQVSQLDQRGACPYRS